MSGYIHANFDFSVEAGRGRRPSSILGGSKMKKWLVTGLLISLNAWSDVSEERRTYPAKYDPLTQTFTPPRIPSSELRTGQRYRAVITQINPDGSLETNHF